MSFAINPMRGTSSAAHANASTDIKPPKYKGGKLNPDWVAMQGTTVPNAQKAPPVVSSMEDKCALETDIGKEIPFTPQMEAAFEEMQCPSYAEAVCLNADDVIDELGKVMSKYEIPIGLTKKLLELSTFDSIEFILDDSGSMTLTTDSKDARGRPMKRKDEALSRMLEMVEVLCYIKAPSIKFRFLNYDNQKVCLELKRKGEAPQDFFETARSAIENMWEKPSWRYTTPMREALEKSFKDGSGKRVVRYVFGDGVPDGKDTAIHAMEKMLLNRKGPQDNPTTFMSCTDVDSETEWMKDLEEKAPFCSESDDYRDELDEVRKDQGDAFPFTRGFYVVCELVAAMNPSDLDCMDECVPYSKQDFDFLQGYVSEERNYQTYFNSFLEAQRARSRSGSRSKEDQIKNQMDWSKLYNELLRLPHASDIPAVRKYQTDLKNA